MAPRLQIRRRSGAPRIVVAALATVLATSCAGAGAEPLDMDRIEQQIQSGLQEQQALQLRVSCPPEVEPDEGERFTCTARNDTTGKLPIEVRQIDSRGTVSWRANLLPTADIEKDIAAQIRKQRDIAANLSCPDAVELEEGGTFTCTARARGEEPVEVRVTQTDARGTVSWET